MNFIKNAMSLDYYLKITIRIICFSVIAILFPHGVHGEYEAPGTFRASTLLEADLLKGEYHQIQERVENDGLFNRYSVSSPYGNFKADSTAALHILIREITAIAAMKKVETDDTAYEAFKESAKDTAEGIKDLFTKPGETLKGAATGVSSLFNRATGTIGRRDVGETEDAKAKQIIGFSKTKGEIASKYGVNVYSRNMVLQAELDRLAWADYLGGLGVGATTAAVPVIGGVVVTSSNVARLLNDSINTTPAGELWLQNKNKLLAMGINKDTVELFLNNGSYSPTLTTVMVSALEAMQGVENLELFIKVGLQAGDGRMARVISSITWLTAGYHQNVKPIKRITPMARLTMAERADGTIVVVLPTDHVIWSRKIENAFSPFIKAEAASGKTKPKAEIWALGDFSKTAHEVLEKAGVEVHINAKKELIPGDK